MLVYITGIEHQKRIENAIYEIQMENTLSIGEPIRSNNINLLQEVKGSLCKNKEITTLLIDLSVITNDDDEIIKAIKTLRFYNNECRFIIIATERFIGDELLSELVNMGIYNIVIDEDEMISKISYFALNNATYKEASVYQIVEDEPEVKKNKKLISKRRIKQEPKKEEGKKVILKTLKNKIFIAVTGSQRRIGVTHTTISMAYTLMKKGYRVAVVEYNENNDYKELKNCYEHSVFSNSFTSFTRINQIDFFNNVSKEMLGKIQALEYDYIILDCGDIKSLDIIEFSRADVKIVLFGSKAWEQRFLNDVYNKCGDINTDDFRFITICDEETKKEVVEGMKPSKVIFPSFTPEPFSIDNSLLEALNGFIYEEEEKKKGFLGLFGRN